MDPTKTFDHLDPKLKDTYARVMGTNDTTPPATDPPPAAAPMTVDPSQTMADPNQFNTTPLDSTPLPTIKVGPNPGTGPAISSLPTDTTTTLSPADAAAPTGPAPDTSAPPNSSFFSNPSPATTDPSQLTGENNLSAPVTLASEPAPTPVTPYTPETPVAAPAAAPSGQFSQPLPSPATVAQTAPHATSPLLKVLYIVLAVIFFAIYTIFWIKVFNLPFFF